MNRASIANQFAPAKPKIKSAVWAPVVPVRAVRCSPVPQFLLPRHGDAATDAHHAG